MASEPDVSEISSLFERLVRNRDMSLFLPFLFGFSDSSSSQRDESTEEDQPGETGGGTTDAPNRERIILVNPFTQGMVVIDGASSLEALFREIGINNGNKGGRPPASKEAIDAMPSFEIKESDGEGGGGEEGIGECVVCLDEYGVGVVVKEMPCKHRFHPNCIEKWLGIHGNCPVCRYEMPVEEKDEGKKVDSEEERGERRRVGNGNGGGEVWVSFAFNRASSRRTSQGQEQDPDQNQNRDQNQAASGGGDDDHDSNDSTPSPRSDAEVEN